MPKHLIFFILNIFFLCLFSLNAFADINILTDDVYNKILEKEDISKSDIKKYKNILKEIKKADFKQAQDKIDQIDNPILMGHILAQKYLHPKYRSSLSELKEWLSQYFDHPQAFRIYKLAQKKGGTKLKAPLSFHNKNSYELKKIPLKYLEKLKPADRVFLVNMARKFVSYLRQGKTLAAKQVLENKRFKKLAPKNYLDIQASKLALKYLIDNHNDKALYWARKASRRSTSGTATWVAGLASWRMHKYQSAAIYFARLGSSKNSDKWLVSAGAYWSYRAYKKQKNDLKSQEMLKLAARHPYTFYGILANYKLGNDNNLNFNQESFINDFDTFEYVEEITQSPALIRALILIKIKQLKLAEREFLNIYDALTPNQKEAVILIAHQHGMHSLVINIARNKNILQLKGNYYKEIYPLPDWSKHKKWSVDPALVLALIRQESAFKATATSNAGAKGLMQLMPNTAYHISKDKSIKRNQKRLLNKDYNLKLGQKYISYLLSKPFIDGNLFYMLTAYNGGPSNLIKWKKAMQFDDDPLMFIEVIPAAETRIYIERVMANYWIYNIRLNQLNPTLEQIANDQWPIIEPTSDYIKIKNSIKD